MRLTMTTGDIDGGYWLEQADNARRELALVRAELRAALERAEVAEARLSNLLNTVGAVAKKLDDGLRLDEDITAFEGSGHGASGDIGSNQEVNAQEEKPPTANKPSSVVLASSEVAHLETRKARRLETGGGS